MNKLAIVILAAGRSQRYGQIKQLADIDGEPMLQRVINQIAGIKDVDFYIAVGAHFEVIKKNIDFREGEVIFNPKWADGMGATIAHVTSQLADQYEGLMLIAGDQPLLGAQQLNPMIHYWRENKSMACCAQYDVSSGEYKVGIPAIFPNRLFAKLKLLQGDSGAKKVLLDTVGSLQTFLMPEAKLDIDRPEDLQKITD